MPQLYFPVYFRGTPKDAYHADLLDGLLAGSNMVNISGPHRGLPNGVRNKKYQSTMTDAEVWSLYSPKRIYSISSTFARPLLVIPCPDLQKGSSGRKDKNEIEQLIHFLCQRLSNMSCSPRNGKHVVFLETEADKLRLESILGSRTKLGKRWMIECDHGWVYVLPLYDQRLWSLRAPFREFLESSNAQLRQNYPSVSEGSSPVSSPRPQKR